MSSIFTISGLLIFAIILLGLILMHAFFTSKDIYLRKSDFFFLMLIFSFASFRTTQNYIFPNSDIFTNDDYHVLEHMGFEMNEDCYLVESKYPEISIWDNFTGSIKIERDSAEFQLSIKDFFKPFYYNQRGSDSDLYVLANNYITTDFSDGLGIIVDQDTLMELKIVSDEDHKKASYLVKYDHFESDASYDTCNFTKTLYKGYPLLDLLLKAPNADKISTKLRDIVVNSYLVRDRIKVKRISKGNGLYTLTDDNAKKLSKLCFFPSGYVLNNPDITLYSLNANRDIVQSDEINLSETFQVNLSDKSLIYAGLGFDRTEEYLLELDADNISKFRLNYILPQMYKLKKDTSIVKLFMTSSNEEVVRNELDGGYFFNVFENPGNRYHINTTLSYAIGDSRTSMHFKIKDLNRFVDESDIFGSNEIIRVHTKYDDLQWLLRFNDLRASNALQPHHIYWLLLTFLVFLFIRLFAINDNSHHLSYMEAGIHLVFFTFIVIRMILSWRASTFVPIEDISAAMFYTLRDIFSFYWHLLFVVIFFWVVLISGILFPKMWDKLPWPRSKARISNSLTKWYKNIKSKPNLYITLGIVFALFVSSGVMAYFFVSQRFAFILWPVMLYFGGDYLISRLYRNRYANKTPSILKAKTWQIERLGLWAFVLIFLLINDAGFGVVFLLFSIVYYTIRYLLFAINKLWVSNSRKSVKNIILPIVYLVPLIGILSIFYFQNFLISNVFTHTIYYLAVTAMAALFLILFFAYKIVRIPRKAAHGIALISSIGVSILLLNASNVQDWLNTKYKYIKYRAEVQNNDIEDLIVKNNFNSSDITYILRSAQNQWFINIYQNAKSDNYFELQPHFGQGSTYTTQTTDLVLLRYIIAEHPGRVVFLLLLLFVALVAICVKSENINSLHGKNALGVLVLLFTIALFIWLTTTNRVIFFGQDYPFLSITSRLAFVLPTLLFLYVIGISSLNDPTTSYVPSEDYNNGYNTIIPLFLLGIMVLGSFTLSKKGRKNDGSTFSMVDTKLNKKIDSYTNLINQEFKDYQLRNLEDNNRLSIDSILQKFYESSNENYTFKKLVNDETNTENFFYRSLLQRMMLKTTNKWDPTEVIHVRKRGKIYNLVNNNRYYSIKSPFENTDSWTGNLLAAPIAKNSGFIEGKSKEIFKPKSEAVRVIPNVLATVESRKNEQVLNYRNKMLNIYMMRIPSEWVIDSVPVFLMYNRYGRSNESQAKFIIYNDNIKIENDETSLVTKIIPEDIISFYYQDKKSKKLENSFQWKYFVENNKYLAKNIWLNGERKFFYPIGKKFNWSYSYTQALKEVFNDSKNENRNHVTSIDYDLTSEVFDIIHKENFPDHVVTQKTRSVLTLFRDLNSNEQSNTNNSAQIYFSENKLNIAKGAKIEENIDLKDIIKNINSDFEQANSSSTGPENSSQILNEIIDRYIKSKFDYSAVVLDGSGKIRLLFDYNKLVKVDPNNLEEYNNYIHRLYRISSNATERDFFGNKSLLSMSPGAGSALKPIVYSSVVSQFNLQWENINIQGSSDNQIQSITVEEERGDQPVRKLSWYGGKNLELEEGRPLWSMDRHNYRDAGLNNKNYLAKSNNLYHSLVVFLGSYSDEQVSSILNPGSSSLLKELRGRINYQRSFPILNIGSRKFSLNPQNWPSESQGTYTFFSKSSSLIADGLHNNFNLYTEGIQWGFEEFYEPLDQNGLYDMVYDSAKIKSNYYYWCYPEYSSFFQLDRQAIPNFRNGVIQPTLGAFPLQVTPLKMAEMTMRMISFNKNKNITSLDPVENNLKDYEFFDFDIESWNDTISYVSWVQDNVFDQMNRVFKSGGTMHFLNDNLEKYRNDGYYFYGKTGTISDESDVYERGKHLMVVITNDKLHDPRSNPLTIQQLKNLKYYVLFLSYHDIRTKSSEERSKDYDPENYIKVIDAVMQSELFHNYMSE